MLLALLIAACTPVDGGSLCLTQKGNDTIARVVISDREAWRGVVRTYANWLDLEVRVRGATLEVVEKTPGACATALAEAREKEASNAMPATLARTLREACAAVGTYLFNGRVFYRDTQRVAKARELLGVPYKLGGRSRAGTDCQGVLFYAAEASIGCGFRGFSVSSVKARATGEVGLPVPGLSPVSSERLDTDALAPGDSLWLVGYSENPAEPAIGELDGHPVWVWHTGVYSGSGNWIVGDHHAGKVIETPLLAYLRKYKEYAGVYVVRGPLKPPVCKPIRGSW